jgi:hypothetical protein
MKENLTKHQEKGSGDEIPYTLLKLKKKPCLNNKSRYHP